jgi:hypothetical protein
VGKRGMSRQERATIFRNVFSTPEGREVLKDLYRSYGKRLSFDKDNARKTDFNEGQRSVYLLITHLGNVDLRTLEEEADYDNG